MELEILPEVNRFNVLRDEIIGLREQQASFLEQNDKVNKEIAKVHESIENRKIEIEQMQQILIEHIKKIEGEIAQEKTNIVENRERHN
mmetsp:Transcript_33045/g.46165  ORF Transcript_33045/g.46165 Transcript_33045/m.46165 type:complete len:88 (-) Transcript_33045:341-604(-)